MLKLAHGIDPLCVLQSAGACLRCPVSAVSLVPSREGIKRVLKERRHGINPQEAALPGLRAFVRSLENLQRPHSESPTVQITSLQWSVGEGLASKEAALKTSAALL